MEMFFCTPCGRMATKAHKCPHAAAPSETETPDDPLWKKGFKWRDGEAPQSDKRHAATPHRLTKEQIEAWRDWWHEPHLHTRPEGKEFAVLCDMALSARSESAPIERRVRSGFRNPERRDVPAPRSASAPKEGDTPRVDDIVNPFDRASREHPELVALARQFERELYNLTEKNIGLLGEMKELLLARSSSAQPNLAAEELWNIFNADRFNRELFRDDTEFADWARNRAQHTWKKVNEAPRSATGAMELVEQIAVCIETSTWGEATSRRSLANVIRENFGGKNSEGPPIPPAHRPVA